MRSLHERSSPRPTATISREPAPIQKLAALALALALLTSVACTDEGDGSADTTGTNETAATGPRPTGGTATGGTGPTATGGTGPTATGGTGTTGGERPEMSITLIGSCSLQGGPAGEALLVFELHLESVGGPYEAETIAVSVDGLPPLSGSSDKLSGYRDGLDVLIGHELDESALGRTGDLEIRTVGTTRRLNVSVPQGLGDAPCHLT